MYKLYKTSNGETGISKQNEDGSVTSFLVNSDNTDYQAFKTAILNQSAQLEDATGTLMTPQDAITYVGTLP
jgi:hypothetical protein